ncbi:hypothetical protein OE88DRAFT_1643951 [Heliocybe sulcata]|uniref:Uncharacterized protein n=1 Tax=Heliocybe sulcata TaxID=5364 RepID=A0A5C3N4Y4_9AGAM|nr:hypothetical protein OE88DRAFT_1643951 [Heliocybe sulcata]
MSLVVLIIRRNRRCLAILMIVSPRPRRPEPRDPARHVLVIEAPCRCPGLVVQPAKVVYRTLRRHVLVDAMHGPTSSRTDIRQLVLLFPNWSSDERKDHVSDLIRRVAYPGTERTALSGRYIFRISEVVVSVSTGEIGLSTATYPLAESQYCTAMWGVALLAGVPLGPKAPSTARSSRLTRSSRDANTCRSTSRVRDKPTRQVAWNFEKPSEPHNQRLEAETSSLEKRSRQQASLLCCRLPEQVISLPPIHMQYVSAEASDTPATAAGGRRRPSALLLRTLKQTRLAAEDFVDVAGQRWRSVRFLVVPEEPGFSMRYRHAGPLSHHDIIRPGYLSKWARLKLPDGGIWNISLFEIARGSKYAGLRAHLLSEMIVTAKVLDTALNVSALQGARIVHPGTGSLLIWKFGQRFLVNFRELFMPVWVIGRSAREVLYLQRLFSVQVRESGSTRIVNYTPFTGRAVVQFERSTLPEHKGTRTVVLRIVEIFELTKKEGIDDAYKPLEPKEGSLLMTRTAQRSWVRWSVDVDQPRRGSSAKALTILFDNEAGQAR